MITLQSSGNFSKLSSYLNRMKEAVGLSKLDYYGKLGVSALSAATPVDSGNTAGSWYYKIRHDTNSTALEFLNSNVNDGVPIAIILEYGHGTGTGGWVQGRDYINPALQPVFDKLLDDLWKEVCL